MARPEALLQQAVATYLAQVLPDNCAWTAIDAGQGQMSAVAGAMRKARGVRSGWPDIILIWRGRFHGIELKAARSGIVSDVQQMRFVEIRAAGGMVAVCRSVVNVAAWLEAWDIDTRFHALTPADRDRMLADRAAMAKPNRAAKPRAPTARLSRRALSFARKAQQP